MVTVLSRGRLCSRVHSEPQLDEEAMLVGREDSARRNLPHRREGHPGPDRLDDVDDRLADDGGMGGVVDEGLMGCPAHDVVQAVGRECRGLR